MEVDEEGIAEMLMDDTAIAQVASKKHSVFRRISKLYTKRNCNDEVLINSFFYKKHNFKKHETKIIYIII